MPNSSEEEEEVPDSEDERIEARKKHRREMEVELAEVDREYHDAQLHVMALNVKRMRLFQGLKDAGYWVEGTHRFVE